jgi:hypothetical protein
LDLIVKSPVSRIGFGCRLIRVSKFVVRKPVHKDPAYGSHPTVLTAPAQAVGAQLRAEQVAKTLRERFVLGGVEVADRPQHCRGDEVDLNWRTLLAPGNP